MKKKATNPLAGTDGQLMVMAAHRYCLGRRSYIVGACIDWLKAHWGEFNVGTKQVMVRDTLEALQDGEAGDDCDWEAWKQFAESRFSFLDAQSKEWLGNAMGHRPKQLWPIGVVNAEPPKQLPSLADGF